MPQKAYRGLPAEIRLMIWSYSVADISSRSGVVSDCKIRWFCWSLDGITDRGKVMWRHLMDRRKLSILQLDKRTREEVLGVLEGRLTMDMSRNIRSHEDFVRFARDAPPLAIHLIGGIVIDYHRYGRLPIAGPNTYEQHMRAREEGLINLINVSPHLRRLICIMDAHSTPDNSRSLTEQLRDNLKEMWRGRGMSATMTKIIEEGRIHEVVFLIPHTCPFDPEAFTQFIDRLTELGDEFRVRTRHLGYRHLEQCLDADLLEEELSFFRRLQCEGYPDGSSGPVCPSFTSITLIRH